MRNIIHVLLTRRRIGAMIEIRSFVRIYMEEI